MADHLDTTTRGEGSAAPSATAPSRYCKAPLTAFRSTFLLTTARLQAAESVSSSCTAGCSKSLTKGRFQSQALQSCQHSFQGVPFLVLSGPTG